MDFVLDTSVTVSWCFEDESSKKCDEILERLLKNTAYVPTLWHLEVGNVLIMAEKKNRINYSRIAEFLSLLSKLDIVVDAETSNKGFHEVFYLSYSEKLTTYDASYLELAMRLGLPLATRDNELMRVAKKIGVKLM